jgi:hypothetical protein
MEIVNITMFAIILLVFLYNNWLPALESWVRDRVQS